MAVPAPGTVQLGPALQRGDPPVPAHEHLRRVRGKQGLCAAPLLHLPSPGCVLLLVRGPWLHSRSRNHMWRVQSFPFFPDFLAILDSRMTT